MPKSRGGHVVIILRKKSIKRKKVLKKMDLESKVDFHNVELNKFRKLEPIREADESSRKDNGQTSPKDIQNGTKVKPENYLTGDTEECRIQFEVQVPIADQKGADRSKSHCAQANRKTNSESQEYKRYSKVIIDDIMTEAKKSTKKRRPPEPRPDTLCFDMKGSMTDHAEVLEQIRKLTKLFKGMSVNYVQFLPKEQRWILTMDSSYTRDRLSGSYVTINGTEVQLRRYDDIAKLEYRKYLRANGLIELVNSIP